MHTLNARIIFAAALAAAVALLGACGDETAHPMRVDVQAEIIEASVPVSVSVTTVSIEEDGITTASHGVRVTWHGDEPVVLGDARFVPSTDLPPPIGRGVAFTAGRGCILYWDEEMRHPGWGCNDDLVVVRLAPGEQHVYPVSLLLSAGTYQLASGTYTVDEPIEWWGADSQGPPEQPLGHFTVRLTYTVE